MTLITLLQKIIESFLSLIPPKNLTTFKYDINTYFHFTMMLKKILSLLLILLRAYLIYLGVKADMLPPSLTGLGFFIITALFNIPPREK